MDRNDVISIRNLINIEEPDRIAISPEGTNIAYTVKKANWKNNQFDTLCYIYNISLKQEYLIYDKNKIISQIIWEDENILYIVCRDNESEIEKKKYLKIINLSTKNNFQLLCTFSIDTSEVIVLKDVIAFYKIGTNELIIKQKKNQRNPHDIQIYFKNTIITNIYASQDSSVLFVNSNKSNKELIVIYELQIQNNLSYSLEEIIITESIYDFKIIQKDPHRCEYLIIGRKLKGIHQQQDLWIWNNKKSSITLLTSTLDFEPNVIGWTNEGILIRYAEDVQYKLGYLNTRTKELNNINIKELSIHPDCVVSKNGVITFIAGTPSSFTDIYLLIKNDYMKITNHQKKFKKLKFSYGNIEKLSWKSQDGLKISGILRKPFETKKKHPLMIIVHGGPKDVSELKLMSESKFYAPIFHLLERNFLILEPNYRGSIGRGKQYLKANVNFIGVKDLWDIESGIKSLLKRKIIDPNKIYCMGWSQGGFITSFAATRSPYFKRISIGASISNWQTYYSYSDMPDFTISYLSGKPMEQKEIYDRCSVTSFPPKFKPEILMFQGMLDRRVPPICNLEMVEYCKKYEISFKSYGLSKMSHRSNTPYQRLFILLKNLEWFTENYDN